MQSSPGQGSFFIRKIRRSGHGNIGAVIFDLDGTLVDSESLYQTAFRDAAATFGKTFRRDIYLQMIGLPTSDRMSLLTRLLGPGFPVHLFVEEYYLRKRQYLAEGAVTVKPGTRALLRWMKSREIPAAVATSCSTTTATSLLDRAELTRSFVTVLTRNNVMRCKPHPDLFLSAAAALGVAPSHCLAVEDSAPGINAAYASGMMPVLIPDIAPVSTRVREKCRVVLKDLHQVRRWLERA